MKTIFGLLVFSLQLHRLVLRKRAVIVAFHSVNEYAGKSDVNCMPALFEKYCAFFSRYFNVVSMRTLLERISNEQSVGGYLVITFDDGYADNLRIAAPILSRLELPATFYVTTGFIDSDTIAPWDAEQGIRSQWMSWQDVEALQAQGFEIGGHTVNHVSLADVSEEDARTEIETCRKTLEEKLDFPMSQFAYPFGGKNNFSAGVRQLVIDSGFESCVSCHGGTVTTGEDLFTLHREPITTRHRSPYHFGFDCVLDVIRSDTVSNA